MTMTTRNNSGTWVAAASLLAAAFLTAAATPARAADLRVGAAAVNITPPLGIPLAGYYHARGADGVIDDLFAKALVLDDGQTQAALVVCDLISVPRDTVVEARQLIEQLSIPGRQVMIRSWRANPPATTWTAVAVSRLRFTKRVCPS
jgi:neutral ceramidase